MSLKQPQLLPVWPRQSGMAGFLHDLRHAARTLRRNPAFLTVVVLTLGFGIGINTATFSIVNAVLIRPLGFQDPDRLIVMHEVLPGFGDRAPFSPPDLLDLEGAQRSFASIGSYLNMPFELSGRGEPARIDGAKVSAALFPTLGVTPLLGRSFSASEDRPGNDLVVLSWGLWQSRYEGSPSVIGQTITLDRRPYTVIGVMPATFAFPLRGPAFNNTPAAVWVPMAFTDRQRQARGNEFNHTVVGRLQPGVTLDAARAELQSLAPQISANYPAVLRNSSFSIGLGATPLREEIVGRMQAPLLMLLGAVGLVLLVTCANVANLVLSRVASRTREVSVRTALGASRGALLKLLFAEALIFSVVGGLLGLALAYLIVVAVPAAVAATLPGVHGTSIDVRVLSFTGGVAILTAFAFAMIPLVTMDRRSLGQTLQEEASRTTPGLRRHRLQGTLVVSTVALACVLLVGAGLFIRSFSALMATDAGFKPDRVLTVSLAVPETGYRTAASVRSFHQSLLSEMSAVPGVRSVALVTDLPFERYERRTFTVEDNAATAGPPESTNLSWVDGPYFKTLGISLKRGRFFTDAEEADNRAAVIVNERLAKTKWPGQDPIGKRLKWGVNASSAAPWLTVVGVVADVADGPLGVEPSIHAYEPFRQFPDVVLDNLRFGRAIKVALLADGNPLSIVSLVRRQITSLDRALAIESINSMAERTNDVVAPRRFGALTLAGFAGGSLLLAVVGLYGLLAFTVGERRREIAVRLALGAEPPAILRMVVGSGMKLVMIGLAIGVAASFGVGRLVATQLYRTNTHDLPTYGVVPIVLLVTALVACALPAYRAARVEPLGALRAE